MAQVSPAGPSVIERATPKAIIIGSVPGEYNKKSRLPVPTNMAATTSFRFDQRSPSHPMKNRVTIAASELAAMTTAPAPSPNPFQTINGTMWTATPLPAESLIVTPMAKSQYDHVLAASEVGPVGLDTSHRVRSHIAVRRLAELLWRVADQRRQRNAQHQEHDTRDQGRGPPSVVDDYEGDARGQQTTADSEADRDDPERSPALAHEPPRNYWRRAVVEPGVGAQGDQADEDKQEDCVAVGKWE